jgi:hypothetical protein
MRFSTCVGLPGWNPIVSREASVYKMVKDVVDLKGPTSPGYCHPSSFGSFSILPEECPSPGQQEPISQMCPVSEAVSETPMSPLSFCPALGLFFCPAQVAFALASHQAM